MQIGTWIMLLVSLAWIGLFMAFTIKDLKGEGKKNEKIAAGEPLDPFMFSGERARSEARELYEKDPLARAYFDENDITPFLTVKGD